MDLSRLPALMLVHLCCGAQEWVKALFEMFFKAADLSSIPRDAIPVFKVVTVMYMVRGAWGKVCFGARPLSCVFVGGLAQGRGEGRGGGVSG